jgi:hypothetical protein
MRPPGSIRPANDRSTLSTFVSYGKDYLRIVPLKGLLFTILFVAVLVTVNYRFGIEKRILTITPWYLSLSVFFLFYGMVLAIAWGIQYRWGPPVQFPPDQIQPSRSPDNDRGRGSQTDGESTILKWIGLLALAPFYFACKMIHWDFLPLLPAGWASSWYRYALIVLQLPAKLILLLLMLWACRKTGGWGTAKGLGLTTAGFSSRPYLLLLLFLTPLIVLASTQPDFLRFYPKVRNLAFINAYAHPAWPWKLLYELSYGLDFLSIELFFRGFLVIGLARWAGPKTILPMAAFYCTVHFGKPLGECVSSFFGGLALGVLAWRTRSILGGLMVHLGLAWMMEIGGWLGGL